MLTVEARDVIAEQRCRDVHPGRWRAGAWAFCETVCGACSSWGAYVASLAVSAEDDLRSRLACVLEATYWDRPYDTRIAAIRGMCDLTVDGMTPTGLQAAPLSVAERRRVARSDQRGFPALVSAIEDVITERMGGIPRIPTMPSGEPS